MTETIRILFKKDWTLRLSALKKGGWGKLTTAVLFAAVIAALLYVFVDFARAYLSVQYLSTDTPFVRQKELMTFLTAAVLLASVFAGTRKIVSGLFETAETAVLLPMPIGARELFVYRVLDLFLSQLLVTAVLLIPLFCILGALAGGMGWTFYLFTVIAVCLLPVLSTALSSLLAFPAFAVRRFLSRHFVLRLAVYAAVLALFFWVYSLILGFLQTLLAGGDLQTLFTRETMEKLSGFAAALYPCNFYALFCAGQDAAVNFVMILLITAACGAAALLLVQQLYGRILKERMEGGDVTVSRVRPMKERGVFASLLHKEFLTVLRNPDYAFSCFATALTMPLMSYLSVSLAELLLRSRLSVSCSFELSLLVISAFTVLTNTFCALNISREGKMFFREKTMPLSGRILVLSKAAFCGMVSGASVLLAVAAVAVGGMVTVGEAFVLLIVCLLVAAAEIFFATRRDLARPRFPSNERDTVTEPGDTVSLLILLGFVLAVLLGGGALGISLYARLTSASAFMIEVLPALFAVALAALVCGGSAAYLFKGLEKACQREESYEE